MSIDRNNRSHRPKGLPPQVAGTYEPATGAMDATDVTPPDPDRTELDRLEREAATLPAPRPGDIAWNLDGHLIPQPVIDEHYKPDDIRCVCSIESGPCERVESLQMSGRF